MMKILSLLLLLANVASSQRQVQEDSLELMGSIVFSLSVGEDVSWDTYESKLIWAVDVVAMEVVSLMETDWSKRVLSSDISSSNHGRKLEVKLNIPSTISPSRTPCEMEVVPGNRCEDIYALVRLWVDGAENPLEVEDSFESIFNAAVELGRLQAVLNESFPELQVQVLSDRKQAVDEPTVLPGTFFGEEEVSQVSDQSQSTNSSEGFPMGAVIGVLIAALLFLSVSVVAVIVVRRKRQYTFYNGKHDLVIETQETDLIESFSQAGLEWGSPEIKVEKQDQCYPKTQDGSFSVEGLPETDSLPPQSPSNETSTSSNSGSSSSSRGSRVVDFTGEIKDSSEPPEVIIHSDGLEAVIMAGDWETLAAAAITIQGAKDGSIASFSRDWSHRDKSWYNCMDASNASYLDRLVEQGDWAGVLDFAMRFGSQHV